MAAVYWSDGLVACMEQHTQGPRNDFYLGGGPNNKKNKIFRIFKILLYKSQILGGPGPPGPTRPPGSTAPEYALYISGTNNSFNIHK